MEFCSIQKLWNRVFHLLEILWLNTQHLDVIYFLDMTARPLININEHDQSVYRSGFAMGFNYTYS